MEEREARDGRDVTSYLGQVTNITAACCALSLQPSGCMSICSERLGEH